MTVIAANLKEMASDTRIIGGGPIGNVDKIYRVGTSLLGICGDAMMARYFVEWFKSPKRNPATLHKALGDNERYEILVMELNPGGLYLWDGWGVGLKLRERYYSIGSGSTVAMAAMKLRKSPAQAVRLAMDIDEGCGGDIVVEQLAKKG